MGYVRSVVVGGIVGIPVLPVAPILVLEVIALVIVNFVLRPPSDLAPPRAQRTRNEVLPIRDTMH